MNKLFLTQEIGSIQRPIWRQKLKHEAKDEWIKDALKWGEKFDVDERFELANDKKTGLLQKKEKTDEEKQRVIDISSIYVIRMLEKAGLDRVFNGEQPRTEMYDTLAKKVNGIKTAGFVNSFDANYFRKGIIENEISIDEKYVKWFEDELEFVIKNTSKTAKSCLTGPYTMVDWSYEEYYRKFLESKGENSLQALKEGRRVAVLDFSSNVLNPILKGLVKKGAKVVQIDEPAASTNEQESSLFVESMNECFKGIPNNIEKAIHLCYSDYPALFPELAECKADTYLIECTNQASGSEFTSTKVNPLTFEIIELFKEYDMNVNVGAGVIDIHSDLIESPEVVKDRLLHIAKVLGDSSRIQVNPDCGLRTRRWDVAFPKLCNMVKGAEMTRQEVENK